MPGTAHVIKPLRRLKNPALFVCDIQEKFRPAIHEYGKVIATTHKMLRAAQILNIPIFVTTQNKARLGDTDRDLAIDKPGGFASHINVNKSAFSMWTADVQEAVSRTFGPSQPKLEAVIVGIESHICVTQTTLDLLRAGHTVYVLADGVSSCNREEVPLALARLRHEGAVVTTSESWIFECVGDAGIDEFKEIAKLVKDSKDNTAKVLESLCKIE